MKSFQEIYKENKNKVYLFLLSLIGDEHMAEEMLQETFYQALIHIESFQEKSSIYTWLCQIGKNAWFQECRRKKRVVSVADANMEEVADTRASLEETVIQKIEYKKIRKIVHTLSEPYQDVFCLHIFGEVKLKEIAKLYGKSESWARVTYYRAKDKILQEVEHENNM